MAIDPAHAKSLFLNAADLVSPAERAEFLNRECSGDGELRARVEALLAAHEKSGNVLDKPLAGLDQTVDSNPDEVRGAATGEYTPEPNKAAATKTTDPRSNFEPGVVIADRYALQEKLGEGGMGEVWVARQTEPVKRKVALKLIKTGMDSKAVLTRFEQERQALALMDHPNIARILDGGLTPSGQPFFVMELVNGLPLTKFCDEVKLTPKERLELFVPICHAVQHAHQKGIVHRDLKPANILVTLIDGKAVPKVIDFGVAKATAGKLTDESMSTQFGAIIGTLEYMAPEQAGFAGEDIDTRADIFSLGVILYELLTGLRPIDAKRLKKSALAEMIRIIQEEEPAKPSTRLSTDESLPSLAALRQTEPKKLMALLRGELDWVVLKCLEKQRARRYETANALSRDIQRYLADEPVEARPPSAGYRLRKFVRRNKGRVIAASLVLLALIGGVIGTSIGLVRADLALDGEKVEREKAESLAAKNAELAASETTAKNKEKAEREKAEDLAKKNADLAASESTAKNDFKYQLSISNELLAKAAYENRNVNLAAEYLKKVPEEHRGWDWRYWKQQTRGGIFTIEGHTMVTCVAYSPDGTRIATAGGDRVKVWDVRTGTLQHELKVNFGPNSLGNGPPIGGGKIVPIQPGIVPGSPFPGGIRVPIQPKIVPGNPVPGGKVVPIQPGLVPGPPIGGGTNVPTRHATINAEGKAVIIQLVAFSPDGTRLITGGGNTTPTVWDVKTGEELLKLKERDSLNVAFSPDGTGIVTRNSSGTVQVWDAKTGASKLVLQGIHFVQAAYSPDGTRIVTAALSGKVEVWDANKGGSPLLDTTPSKGAVRALSYSSDGSRIVVNETVIDATTGVVLFELMAPNTRSLSYSPDSTRIVTGGTDRLVKVWDGRTGEQTHTFLGHTGEILGVAFSPDGAQIVSGSTDGTAKVWDAQVGTPQLELNGAPGDVLSAAFNRILTGKSPYKTVWDARNGKLDHQPKGQTIMAFSQDATRIVSRGSDGKVKVRDAKARKELFELEGIEQTVNRVAFSEDGARIVTVKNGPGSWPMEGLLKVWDGRTGKFQLTLKGTMRHVSSVAFSPDGARIVAGIGDVGGSWPVFGTPGEAMVWDAQTGEILTELKRDLPAKKTPNFGPGGKDAWTRLPVLSVAFSPDGTRIVTGHTELMGIRGEANVWDARTGELQLSLKGHAGNVSRVAFSPDGTRILTGSWDKTAKVWDARTGTALVELKGHDGPIIGLAFSPDEKWIVTSGGGKVIVWGTGTGKELLDEEEIAYRRENTQPDPSRYQKGYLAAKADRNDFAAKFYRQLVLKHDSEAKAWIAAADMKILRAQAVHDVEALAEFLDLQKTLVSPEDPEVLKTMSWAGERYRMMGQPGKAVPLYDHVIKVHQKKLGVDDPATIDAMNRLGSLYREMKDFEKSVPLFKQIVKILEEKHGRDQPTTRDAIENLGMVYSEARKYEDAIPLLEKVEELWKELWKREYSDRAVNDPAVTQAKARRDRAAKVLLDLYARAGKDAKVDEWLAKARKSLFVEEIGRKFVGQEGLVYQMTLPNMLDQVARIYLEEKKWARAEPIFRECLTIRQKRQPDALRTFHTQSMLGEALLGQKKYAEAEPLLLKGYEGVKLREGRTPPPGQPCLSETVDRLIDFYTATNRPDDEKKWRVKRATLPEAKEPLPKK